MTARWRYAAFGVALGAVWLVLLLWAAGIDPREPLVPARTHSLPGSRYHAVFGKATPDGQRLRVSSAAEDYSALQATALADLAAADFPILRYSFDGFPHTLELSLVFRTSDAPDDVQAISLPAPTNGSATFDLSRTPAWRGTIVEAGFSQFPVAQLVPPAEGFRPFELVGARLESQSWRGRLAATWSSWFAHSPWQLISVSAIGPSETGDGAPHAPRLPLVLALALAGFAGVARLVLHWRGGRLARAVFTAAVLAWLGLDVAWLREVGYRRGVDKEIWGAIPFAQRQDYIADDHTLAAATRLKILLGNEPPTTRILVNAQTPHEVLRLVYLLSPLNASGVGGLVNAPPSAVQVGTILVNYNIDRPRPLIDVMRIGRTRARVKVIDRNQDLVVYRVQATIP
ncbi:MAG: hypothetical protein ACTHK2_03700 [Dokdonella sp.]|uniref:hypothetical protein n=1 Tax=Dokdonella sp. TaxID=2291710 RepID=UPI003F7CEDBB